MTSKFRDELLELLSSAADEGFTAERVAAVEAMLRARPELVGVYEDWMALHVSLKGEFSLTGLGRGLDPEQMRGGSSVVSTHQPLAAHRAVLWLAGVGAVAAGLIGWLGFPTSEPELTKPVAVHVAESDRDSSAAPSSWPQLRLASFRVGDEAPLALTSTPVWLQRFNDYPARGYIVPLPPNSRIEASIDASAEGPNRIAISELSDAGEPLAGPEVIANRVSDSDEPAVFGRVGQWHRENRTERTRYFLFAGLHQLHEAPPSRRWRVSDFAVLVREPHLMHIGWDDSGINVDGVWPNEEEAEPDSFLSDRDFDDMSVTVRIQDLDNAETGGEVTPRLYPPVAAAGSLGEDHRGWDVDVLPGQVVIVRAIAGHESDCRIAVADASDGRVVWRHSNQATPAGSRLRFHRDPAATHPNAGVFCVENRTDERARYAIVAKVRTGDEASQDWYESAARVHLEANRYTIVGFENGPGDTRSQDIWVTVHRIGSGD
ncbi:MAG: hypothetical protein AAF266_12330 [Planctomycetota bacterium]